MKNLYLFIIAFILISFIIFNSFQAQNKYAYITWENEKTSTFSQNNPYDIYIDLSEYNLYLFKDGVLQNIYPIAGGKEETPSPYGVWKVISKGKWGKGFGGYWLGLNVPWGKYGIHGTTRPGSIGQGASHGCIRMFSKNAEELWKTVPYNTPVLITKGAYSPFGLHPRTLVPGDTGADVMYVQMILKKKGLYIWDIDGIYGDAMKDAIFKLQEQAGIPPHNEIDKQTLKAIGVFRFE